MTTLQRSTLPAPSYFGLRCAAFIMGTMATLGYVLGASLIVIVLLAGLNQMHLQDPMKDWNRSMDLENQTVAIIASALVCLAAGAILHGASALCIAARNVAIDVREMRRSCAG